MHLAARQEDTGKVAQTATDTVQPDFMKEKGAGHIKKNMEKFRIDKLSIRQDDLLEKVKKNIDKAWNYMKNRGTLTFLCFTLLLPVNDPRSIPGTSPEISFYKTSIRAL